MAKAARKTLKQARSDADSRTGPQTRYPRHTVKDALRIPAAMLTQNAGRTCTDLQAVSFVGLKSAKGPVAVEISSAIKYGFLNRPVAKKIELTELGRQALKPKSVEDEKAALHQAILNAPVFSDVYNHYRGENIPDSQFFDNALEDNFSIDPTKVSEFKDLFLKSLKSASLIAEHDGRMRVLDSATSGHDIQKDSSEYFDRISTGLIVSKSDSCFVVMPFAPPIGDYYLTVYKPAIEKAQLIAVRADNEIFGTGKIMDQIWSGINAAKVLVAELTTKNANVFYELGVAHALEKPVVLVSSNEDDVPFDLRHIRVIYYDKNDPFWGQKLVNKVAENIVSAIKNPEEAVFDFSKVRRFEPSV